MSWIKKIEENETQEELKEIFDRIKKKHGYVSNFLKILALNSKAMKAHIDFYVAIMFNKSGLKPEECEIISVITSAINKCKYCLEEHSKTLNKYWKDKKKVKQFIDNIETFNLSERLNTIRNYVIKLTKNPTQVTENDIKNLKQKLNDEEILNVNLVCSYFNLTNRISIGLGL